MTLIIAFKGKAPESIGGDALVIGSDSRETYGLTMYRTKKIIPILLQVGENLVNLCTVAGSGDSALIKNIIGIIEKKFKDRCINDWSGNRPTYEQFSETIHLIEQAVISRLSYYRSSGLNISLSIIVCGVDSNGKASLWEIDQRGVAQKIDDFPGYTCIGSGFVLGGNLLLQQFLDPLLVADINRGTVFAAYVIDQVSQVDPAVGPFDGELFLINKNGVYSFGKDKLPRLQREIRARQRVLRKLFMAFDRARGAENFDKAITEGLRLLAESRSREMAQETQSSEAEEQQ